MAVPECRSLNVKRICCEWLSSGSSTGRNESVKTFCPLFTSCWAFFFFHLLYPCVVMWQFYFYVSHSHCLCPMCHLPTPSLPTPPLLSTSREAGAENWGTEGCQTLASTAVHTKCLCSRISTYAVLAQQAKDPVSHLCKAWCTLWDFGVLTRQLLPGGEGAQVSELIFCTQTPATIPVRHITENYVS